MILTGYIIFAVAVSIGLGILVADGKAITYTKPKTKQWKMAFVTILSGSIFLSLFIMFYGLIVAVSDIISAIGR